MVRNTSLLQIQSEAYNNCKLNNSSIIFDHFIAVRLPQIYEGVYIVLLFVRDM